MSKNNKGMALLFALLMLTMVSIAIDTAHTIYKPLMKFTEYYRDKVEIRYLAECGIYGSVSYCV